MISLVVDHLWQSTLLAVLIALTVLLMKRNAAHIRYWLWLAASIKFLIPLSVLMFVGSQVEWKTERNQKLASIDEWIEASIQPASSRMVRSQLSGSPEWGGAQAPATGSASPAAPSLSTVAGTQPDPGSPLSWIIGIVWLTGFTTVAAVWYSRWKRMRSLVADASPLGPSVEIASPIPLLESPTSTEPGVVGIFHPVLLLPKGITDHLTEPQLRAVLAHEFAHWRRRDNLTASLHMVVEAIFWFHPIIWWIGARLVDERERACDEATLSLGEAPEVYAEGILNVCQYYVAPPLRGTSTISGGNLRRRIDTIVSNLDPEVLSMTKKLILTALAVALVGGPLLLGSLIPGDEGELIPSAAAQDTGSWRDSPFFRSLYDQARQEGEVLIVGLDRRDVAWLIETIPEEFPGIEVSVATTGLGPSTIPDVISRPGVDLALTPLMEAKGLYEAGQLARLDWSEFGVPSERVALDGAFAYASNTVYTVAYDTRRVNNEALRLYILSPAVSADRAAFLAGLRSNGEGDFPITIVPPDVARDASRLDQIRAGGALVEISAGEDPVAVTLDAIRERREAWVDPVPSTWRELLDPQFRGVLLTNPFVMARVIGGLGLVWGEEEAMQFARELRTSQDLRIEFNSQFYFLDEHEEQSYFVGMPNPFTELWQRAGLSVAYVVPEPVVMLQWGPVVLSQAPHPAAAQLVAGWLLSPEGQRLRQHHTARSSLLPGSENRVARNIYSDADREVIFDTPETADERARLYLEAFDYFSAQE